jgi:hypothetical protein
MSTITHGGYEFWFHCRKLWALVACPGYCSVVRIKDPEMRFRLTHPWEEMMYLPECWKSWMLLGMLMTLHSCSSAYLSVGISIRPFIARLNIHCTFPEPAFCSFPPVHLSPLGRSPPPLVCCFGAFALLGGGFGYALWESTSYEEGYEWQGI